MQPALYWLFGRKQHYNCHGLENKILKNSATRVRTRH